MASTRPSETSDLPALSRRRMLREQRRRRRRVAGAAIAILLLVVAAGVAVTHNKDARSRASGPENVRSGNAKKGRGPALRDPTTAPPTSRRKTKATPPTTHRRPKAAKNSAGAHRVTNPPSSLTTIRPTTSDAPKAVPPAAPRSSAPRASAPTVLTAPPASATTEPAHQEIDPQSPPATRPPGAQGPVREAACASTGPPKVRAAPEDGPNSGGQWVTIASLAGNCGASSAALTTTGVDTRLVYRSDAADFQVFVVDQSDVASSSGFADVECHAPCADTQDLTDPAGRYRLKVVATDAPWQVSLQEFR